MPSSAYTNQQPSPSASPFILNTLRVFLAIHLPLPQSMLQVGCHLKRQTHNLPFSRVVVIIFALLEEETVYMRWVIGLEFAMNYGHT